MTKLESDQKWVNQVPNQVPISGQIWKPSTLPGTNKSGNLANQVPYQEPGTLPGS